jgi:uncharacterized membrane protein YeaQ/YmgE (transglycosylase-associated protein family)
MNIISWILFGLIVGIVANAIDPRPARGGIFNAMLLGVVGALIGGFLSDLVFGVGITGFNLTSFLIAVAGSLVLLFIGRAMRRA